MARHRAERPDKDDTVEESTDPNGSEAIDDTDDELDDDTADDGTEDDESDEGESDEEADDEETARSKAADDWWSDVRVDVVELALPSGVGYTLRAYRMTDEVAPDEEAEESAAEEEEPPPPPKKAAKDAPKAKGKAKGKGKGADEEAEEPEPAPSGKRGKHRTAGKKRDEEPEEEDLDEDLEDEDLEDEDFEDEELDEEEEAEPEPEEIPTFLAHDGRLLLFRTPEALVSYVRSGAPNDLAVIDTWDQVVSGIKPDYVAALADDKYELDLIVDNLRGGHDAWEPDLVISAGEVARDLGYALRIEQILTALSPESPLDDLDEAMRAAAGGGLGSFFARRRLKKIGAQQAALAWRTIIGKITTATDWRD